MKGLCINETGLSLDELSKPENVKNELLIKVAYAGVCRTDLNVISGSINCNYPLIPGHEFSGIVEAGNGGFHVGDRVAVNPIQPCLNCGECELGIFQLCSNSKMLGMKMDGAFCEYVKVRSDLVHKIPEHLSLQKAAFLEPVAANLAVFNAGIKEEESGLILGDNRIARLMAMIMKQKGYRHVGLDTENAVDSQYDYIIETQADESSLNEAIKLLKPRGKLIIKSRCFNPTGLIFAELIAKEIQCCAVNYGSYQEAVSLLKEGLPVEDLMGKSYLLHQYEEAFIDAEKQEQKKVFFEICAES